MKVLKITLLLFAVLLLYFYAAPALYGYLFIKGDTPPFILYSEVLGEFVRTRPTEGELIREDIHGHRFSQSQFDSILPTFFYRQLAADRRLPDTLLGRHISAGEIQATNFTYRYSPTQTSTRRAGVYRLLESHSGRVRLQMAEDLFTFRKEGITFIDSHTRKVNPEKSEIFRKAFAKAGFTSSPHLVAGDGNPKKEYDEGYLVVDSHDQLFHFKMVEGMPYIREIDISTLPGHIMAMDLCGFSDRRRLAYLMTDRKEVYFLNSDYTLSRLELPPFDAMNDDLLAIGNMFCTTYRVVSDDAVHYAALDTESGSLLKMYDLAYTPRSAERVAGWIFPVILKFTDAHSTRVYPHFTTPWSI